MTKFIGLILNKDKTIFYRQQRTSNKTLKAENLKRGKKYPGHSPIILTSKQYYSSRIQLEKVEE